MGRKKLPEDKKKAQTPLKADPSTLGKVESVAARLDLAEGTVNRVAHKIGMSVVEQLVDDEDMTKFLAALSDAGKKTLNAPRPPQRAKVIGVTPTKDHEKVTD